MEAHIHKPHTEKKDRSWIRDVVLNYGGWLLAALIIVGGTWAKDWMYHRWQYTEFTIHSLTIDTKRDRIITDILYTVLEKKQADRVYIFRFHNGGVFAGGVPFKKCSNTHEVVHPGVSREINNLQEIPLSTIPEFTEMIVKHADIFSMYTEDLPRGTFRSILEQEAIHTILIHRLMVGDEVWGFVGVDYMKKVPIDDPQLEIGYGELNNAAHLIELELQRVK